MDPTTDLLTSTEVSHLLGVSIKTVHRRIDSGELAVWRKLPGPNGAYLFRREDVDALIARTATAATGPPANSATADGR